MGKTHSHETMSNTAPPETLSDAFQTFAVWGLVAVVGVKCVNAQLPWNNAWLLHSNTWDLPTAAVCVYLIMVGYAKNCRPMSKTEPAWADAPWMMLIVKGWNLFLAFASIVMLVGMAIPMVGRLLAEGPVAALCDRDAAFGTEDGSSVSSAMFWTLLFVFSKYAELFDTVILMLRRKPIIFLHWFHHWTVLATTWAYVCCRFVPGIWFGVINASVHTLMYHFYYRAACRVKLTYPKLITTVQLTQMVAGILLTTFWTYLNWSDSKACPSPDHHLEIIMATYAMYGSYLVLFAQFYVSRYLQSRKEGDKDKKN